jgi:type I restriction enzyme S subunit
VQAGDSLISITADVGMVGIVPEGFEEAYINQHVSLARPVLPEMGLYLAWLLSGDFSKEQFKALQRGATKVGLGLDDIKAIHFGLPSLEEQGEIVRLIEDKLGAMERLDKELDLKVVKAEKNKQSVLASAFSGGLVGSLVSDSSAKELLASIKDSRLKVVNEKSARNRPQKKSREKVVKKLIVDVLKDKGEISVSSLMQEVGYKPDEIETFYDDLSAVSDSIVELRPKGSKAKSWPYDNEIKLKLK